MLIIPERQVQLLWQSTIVDIGPGTKYRHKSDAASINSDLCLYNLDSNDLVVPLSFLTSDHGGGQAPNPSIRIKKETKENLAEVEKNEQNAKKLEETVVAVAQQQGQDPEAARQYIKNALASAVRHHKTMVTVKAGQKLYLRTYHRHRIVPKDGLFEFSTVAPLPQFMLVTGGSIHVTVALPRPVDGFNVTLDSCTQGFELQSPVINQRQFICWRWQNDPALFVKYRY